MSIQVSYRKIDNILPHTNADSLEIAIIGGWHCVVRKGEFAVGDHGVFFQEGSLLPDHPEFEFMRSKKFKIKTIKIRDEISQGLFMKPETLVSYPALNKFIQDREVGDSLDDYFHDVKKIEDVIMNNSETGGTFPIFIPKTGLERFQNLVSTSKFEKYRNADSFYVTEKLDGQSLTVYYDRTRDSYLICSKNIAYTVDSQSSFVLNAKRANLLEIVKNFSNKFDLDQVCFQGELCGPGIQANRLKLEEKRFFLYSIYDCVKKLYLPFFERQFFSTYLIYLRYEGIHIVPVLFPYLKLSDYPFTDNEHVIRFADRQSVVNSECMAEGLVFVSLNNSSVRFKVISNNYLFREN